MIVKPDRNFEDIFINGDLTEDIRIGFNNQGYVDIRGNCSSTIVVGRNNQGFIRILGDLTGNLLLESNNIGQVEIVGSVTGRVEIGRNNTAGLYVENVAADGVLSLGDNFTGQIRIPDGNDGIVSYGRCLLYTSPSPRDS